MKVSQPQVSLTRRLPQWVLSRFWLFVLLLPVRGRAVVNGAGPYWSWSRDVWCHGVLPGRDFPWEYPPGALPFIALPLGCSTNTTFLLTFVAFALGIDLVVLLLLRGLPRGRTATRLWLVAVPLLGPIAVTRFDISACLFVVLGLRWAIRRPGAAAAVLTIGTAVKLWPAALVGLLVARREQLGRVVTGTVVTAIVVLGLCLASGTTPAFRTALHYQSARGLQIESVPALPWMLGRMAGAGHVSFRYGAFEVLGRGSSAMALISSGATLAAVGALLLRILLRRRPEVTLDLPLVAAAVVATLIVTDKVLSPQYLLWLAAALAVLAGSRSVDRRVLILGGVAAGLTPLIFPFFYTELMNGAVEATALLLIRDLALLGVAVLLYREAWRSCSPGPVPAEAIRMPARL